MPTTARVTLSHNLKTEHYDNKNFLCNRIRIGPGNDFPGNPLFLSPEVATAAFGIRFNANGDYSFHHIKGIKDIFSGLLLCALVLMKERRALGMMLLVATIIPVSDVLTVLSKSYNGIPQAMPHISAIIVCSVVEIILLVTKPKIKAL